MTGRWNKAASLLGRCLHSWQAPTAVGVLLLIGTAYWLAPRRVDRVIPVDGSTSWRADEAPPRREIIWRPAREIPALFKDDPQAELVAPKLAADGAALYFSRRIDGRQSDLYVSTKLKDVWQPARPVAELNTPANEVGPVLSGDGRRLYFYSDRAGGLGGTDIYVATRHISGEGWNDPQNLGPKINSSAHEYGPALSGDGLSLYFASNRTSETARRIADDRQNGTPEWNVTLRAQLDLTSFDLYRARRAEITSAWEPSTALDQLNRPGSTEGAPFLSPGGTFLYFASDRAAREGERRNLDLYRARLIGDGFGPPENLGPGINTPAHETEPGLSAEGFTIVFSSNRGGSDRLYTSTAAEVYHETGWETSHLKSLGVPGWWWVPVLLMLLAACVLALLYYRNWLLERVWPARFFLGSVLLNLLVLLLLALWTLPEVMDAVIAKIEEIVPAPEFVDNNQHQSHIDGRAAHEKVADLKAVEPVPVPELVRKETVPLSVPRRNERLVPTIPARQAQALPRDEVIFVPPRQNQPLELQPEAPRPLQLARSRPRQPVLPFEERRRPEQMPQLDAVPAPRDDAVPRADVEMARRAIEQPADNVPPRPLRFNPLARRRPQAATIENVAPADQPPPLAENAPKLMLARNVRAEQPAAVAGIEAPQRAEAGATVPAEPAPAPAMPEVGRTRAALIDPQAPSRPDVSLPPTTLARREMSIQPAAVTLPDGGRGAEVTPQELARTRPVEVAGIQVTPGRPLPAIDPADVPSEMAIAAAEVEIDRSAANRPKAGLGETADRPPTAEAPSAAVRPLELAAADLNSPLPATEPGGAAANPPSRLVRDRSLPAQPGMSDEADAVELLAVLSEQKLELEPGEVQLAKTSRSLPDAVPADEQLALPAAEQVAALREQLALADTGANDEATQPPQVPAPLRRATPREQFPLPPTDAAERNAVELVQAETPQGIAPESVEVALLRTSARPLAARVPTPKEMTGPASRLKHRVVIGELSDERNEAPPAFSPLANRLDRRRALATRVALAEDNVGLKMLFTLRRGDTRRKYIELLGGTDESEKAVNLGLEWLAKHQEDDGSWDLKKNDGTEKSRTAGTGFGLLPFLAAGHTHDKPGRYQKTVRAAIDWLLEHQQEDGNLLGPGDNQPMYSHGIAAIALCEAYGMTHDKQLKEPARRALDFIVGAQHQGSGGWRYSPNQSADTSVVGWQMMALKSGEMAGLSVAQPVYENVIRWLESVEGRGEKRGRFGYTSRSGTPAMTAEGLLSLQFMGVGRNSPRMRGGADYLLSHLPDRDQRLTSYYWYYATQVMYHMQGKYWEAWNGRLRDILVDTQIKSGDDAGSWHPRDRWESRGGRVYSTSLKLLMLEVYYRHLPLYEQLEE